VLATALFLVLYWLHRSDPMDEGGDPGEHTHAAD
jgi:hypothetical protein